MTPAEDTAIRIQLINDLSYELVRWQGRAELKNAEQARRFVKEQVVYSLRMIWQGRFDKFSKEHCEIIDRLSMHYLPTECGYTGAKRSELVMKPEDHTKLAEEVFAQLWADYITYPGHDLPRPIYKQDKPKSLYERLLALFK